MRARPLLEGNGRYAPVQLVAPVPMQALTPMQALLDDDGPLGHAMDAVVDGLHHGVHRSQLSFHPKETRLDSCRRRSGRDGLTVGSRSYRAIIGGVTARALSRILSFSDKRSVVWPSDVVWEKGRRELGKVDGPQTIDVERAP